MEDEWRGYKEREREGGRYLIKFIDQFQINLENDYKKDNLTLV